jgi:acetyl-CoA C-acetyltransferase
VEAACATGSAAVRTAYHMIASGEADIVMAIGVEKMNESPTPTVAEFRAGNYFWEFENFAWLFQATMRCTPRRICADMAPRKRTCARWL